MTAATADKPLVWLRGAVKTPPFSADARVEAGTLLRRLQRGEKLTLPHSRPMGAFGTACHELRIRDRDANWRLLYRVDPDAVIVVDVFAKKTSTTPRKVIDACRRRLAHYDEHAKEHEG